jgi:hypothetical protein
MMLRSVLHSDETRVCCINQVPIAQEQRHFFFNNIKSLPHWDTVQQLANIERDSRQFTIALMGMFKFCFHANALCAQSGLIVNRNLTHRTA